MSFLKKFFQVDPEVELTKGQVAFSQNRLDLSLIQLLDLLEKIFLV